MKKQQISPNVRIIVTFQLILSIFNQFYAFFPKTLTKENKSRWFVSHLL